MFDFHVKKVAYRKLEKETTMMDFINKLVALFNTIYLVKYLRTRKFNGLALFKTILFLSVLTAITFYIIIPVLAGALGGTDVWIFIL